MLPIPRHYAAGHSRVASRYLSDVEQGWGTRQTARWPRDLAEQTACPPVTPQSGRMSIKPVGGCSGRLRWLCASHALSL